MWNPHETYPLCENIPFEIQYAADGSIIDIRPGENSVAVLTAHAYPRTFERMAQVAQESTYISSLTGEPMLVLSIYRKALVRHFIAEGTISVDGQDIPWHFLGTTPDLPYGLVKYLARQVNFEDKIKL